jgi:hypothetical protein
MQHAQQWPNFFIIGSVKSGTGAIARIIGDHPEAFLPETKELHFFSDLESKYSSEEAYCALYEKAPPTSQKGDASGGYFFDPTSPGKIKAKIGPEAKLICILRDPSRAIYSLWGQLVKTGLEKRSASKAILTSFDDMTWAPEK